MPCVACTRWAWKSKCGRRSMTLSRKIPRGAEMPGSLAAIDGAPVGQHVQVTRAVRAVLHPVLELRFRARALRAEVLVLAARVLLAKLARAAGEYGETQEAVVHLVRQRQEPGVIHVGKLRCNRVEVVGEEG